MFKKIHLFFLLIIVSTILIVLGCPNDKDSGGNDGGNTSSSSSSSSTSSSTSIPPLVSFKSITPYNEENVNTNTDIRIIFNGLLDETLSEGEIMLYGYPIDRANITVKGDTITVKPSSPGRPGLWTINERYKCITVKGFKTTYGDQYGGSLKYIKPETLENYYFKTRNDDVAQELKIINIEPDPGNNIDIDTQIKIRLSIDLKETPIGSVKLGDKTFTSGIMISGNEIIVNTTANPLSYSQTYTGITVSGFITIEDENVDLSNNTYSFTTKAESQSVTTSTSITPQPIPFDNTNEAGTSKPAAADAAYSEVDRNSWANATYKLGANYNGNDVEFAVYSKNGSKVLLEIYEAKSGVDAKYDYWMVKNVSDNIWRAKLKDIPNGTLYGFRVWGPTWTYNSTWRRGNSSDGFGTDVDMQGNRFNPNKVLFDPYAKELTHNRSNPQALGDENGGMFGTGNGIYNGIARREFDTGKWAPKAVVVKDTTSFGTKPTLPLKDAIIYEAHLKGITNHPSTASLNTILSAVGINSVSNIPSQYQGTYKGATYLIPYFQELGINTIEFLPIHDTDGDANSGNYWGYMTYGFFAPNRKYSSDKSPGGPTKEFKEMVAAFHQAGMQIYLDVVYNHTGEGGTWVKDDPTTAELTFLRGFDNSEYYALGPDDKRWYWDGTTGCGNALRADNEPGRKLIIDSLTYWIDEMGVDGFRFDLAPVLATTFGNTKETMEKYIGRSAQVIKDISALGTSRNVKMIAEAWDCKGAHVGDFPTDWGEWNGNFRDAVRKFIKGETPGEKISQFINGDWEWMGNGGNRTPEKSINFIIAHDGFTLTDLVSYNLGGETQNPKIAAPFGPSDGGSDNNMSWDHGGDEELRRKQIRNFFTLQMFSRGTPMIVWGDEFGRTQNGNNNPYNIDTVATWSNYYQINTGSPTAVPTNGGGEYHNNLGSITGKSVNTLFLFAKYVMNLRKNEPILRSDNYASPIYTFSKETGWSNYDDKTLKCISVHINGDPTYYVMFINTYTEMVSYQLPYTSKKWGRIIDTATDFESNNNCWNETNAVKFNANEYYGVGPRCIVVFKEVNP